jgi:uncharacterized glyoxalase superfamily protein PhnB
LVQITRIPASSKISIPHGKLPKSRAYLEMQHVALKPLIFGSAKAAAPESGAAAGKEARQPLSRGSTGGLAFERKPSWIGEALDTKAPHRPAFIPSVIYRDNRAALKWLQEAFGFEISELITDAENNIVHAEMSHGDGIVMIGSEFADWTSSPLSVDGKNTQRIHVRLAQGVDAHCEKARRAGVRWSQRINFTAIAPTSPSTPKATAGLLLSLSLPRECQQSGSNSRRIGRSQSASRRGPTSRSAAAGGRTRRGGANFISGHEPPPENPSQQRTG